jgi:hypothetical protein
MVLPVCGCLSALKPALSGALRLSIAWLQEAKKPWDGGFAAMARAARHA